MNNTNNIADDEIDLIELMLSVWKKKWWVIFITAIFAVGSIGYVLTAEEQWTSKAEVIAPRNYEIANILSAQLKYANITDEEQGDLSASLYSSFMTELRSVNSRVNFFKQSSIYKKLTEGMDESQKSSILRNLASKSISIQWPDKKKEIDYPVISLSMTNPEDAQLMLQEYIQYLNKHVFDLYNKSFLVNLDNKIFDLEFAIKKTEEQLPLEQKIVLDVTKDNLQKALATAKDAGIKEYAKSDAKLLSNINKIKSENGQVILMPDEQSLQAQISTRLSRVDEWFLLGEKYLQAQIDNLDKTPLVFPASYYFQKKQLQQLQALREMPKNYENDQAFHYQSAPYLPLQRDKPKRALIVLIGTFAGSILGILFALLMGGVESYKRRKAIV